jgi:hypothetical protein
VTRAVLTLSYAIWLILPLFGFALNQSYDPTRLIIYPVRYQTLFAASVVGGLCELSTFLLLPIMVALLAIETTSAVGFLFNTFIILLFLLQTIALGQFITFLLLGFLRSRRFRDIMIVAFPLLAFARYLFTPRNMDFSAASLHSPLWRIAGYLPPGWAATALSSSAGGNWLRACEFGVMLAFASVVTVGLATTVLRKIFEGERGASGAFAHANRPVGDQRKTSSLFEFELRGARLPIFAVAQKEWRYILRDPQYKALAATFLYAVFAFGFMASKTANPIASEWVTNSTRFLYHFARLTLPMDIVGLLIFSIPNITNNIFGGEGAAITVLFSSPIPRSQIVIGKNIAHGAVILFIGMLAVAVSSYLTHNLPTIALTVLCLFTGTLLMLAAGNIASVKFPLKFVFRGNRFSQGGNMGAGASGCSGAGCIYTLIQLGFMLGTLIVGIPVMAAIIFPSVGLISPDWYFLTVPFALLYSGGAYAFSIYLVDTWMVTREHDIIQKLSAND